MKKQDAYNRFLGLMSTNEIKNFIEQYDLTLRSDRYAILYKLHKIYLEKNLKNLFISNI